MKEYTVERSLSNAQFVAVALLEKRIFGNMKVVSTRLLGLEEEKLDGLRKREKVEHLKVKMSEFNFDSC